MSVNPEYKSMGDDYWTPDIINSTWGQAHTGKIPVSGAGYRGKFCGEGFDSMWTDMSEIVRPTRDGIHGREYINTLVELTRRPLRLKFNVDGSMTERFPEILEIPLPVMFQTPSFGMLGDGEMKAMVSAAKKLGTLMIIQPEIYKEEYHTATHNLVPALTVKNYQQFTDLVKTSRMVEIADEPGVEKIFTDLRNIKHGLSIAVGVRLNAQAADRAVELAKTDVDVIHFYATENGRELDAQTPRTLRDMIREVHLGLVKNNLRHKINLIFSGGIALAEHMAKAMLCGADAIVIDNPLLVALECRLCYKCKSGLPCPVKLEEVKAEWGVQRIENLVGAWHNQLIEVMGACGIREARRLRGEVGRSLWFEDLERDSFGPLFGSRKVAGIG